MAGHDRFLAELEQASGGSVFLLNRFADRRLGLGDGDTLRVFIPDLHWMSQAAVDLYTGGYTFNGSRSLPGGRPLFDALLDAIEAYRAAAGPLEVIQLGDRFDLWREASAGGNDVAAMYRRIRSDAAVAPFADRLDALAPVFIRGNHDHWLNIVEKKRSVPPSHDEYTCAAGRIVVTHGHRYDMLEMLLPDDFQAAVVRAFPRVRAGVHDVGLFTRRSMRAIRERQELRRRNPALPYPDVRPDGGRAVASRADVTSASLAGGAWLDVTIFQRSSAAGSDFDHLSFLAFADLIRDEAEASRDERRVVVIGHTHHARLLVDEHPVHGGPLVTMDCGAWNERCTVLAADAAAADVAPSAQVGVQCGNDLRIYQIGG
jgi:UDP-2,3-diacylglucosamine pyrophosphatase LpxH